MTAVEIKDRHAADTRELPHLLHITAENFNVREISAHKAYSSHANFDFARQYGVTPYIAFRANTTGRGPSLWEKMFHHFSLHRADFLAHYHKRSNVESTFSMVKAKFRDHLRSKTPVAMVNEVLRKIICHNICVLIPETHELGIDAVTPYRQVTVDSCLREMTAWPNMRKIQRNNDPASWIPFPAAARGEGYPGLANIDLATIISHTIQSWQL